jgi:iron(III) transport system ATP-binding protein
MTTSAAEVPQSDVARPRLALERISLWYPGVTALDDVSLAVSDGEILCLLGPSGSGKSTLLRIIAGIEHPSSGRVVIDGIEVAGPRGFVEPEDRRVGMVFQDYALFPHLTVAANVAFGLKGRPRADVDHVVGRLLDRLGLTRYADSYPHELSGGERQRVALARAMAPSPRILLMDEPFSSLDGRLRDDVRRHTMAFLREAGTTTIVVTHDPDEALRIADRVGLLRAGRLVQCGYPDELYTQPATLFAARVFSDVNVLRGTCCHGRVDTPLGSFAAPQLPEQTPACVCIRPEHLRVAARPGGIPTRVVNTARLGEVEQLSLAVEGHALPLTVRAFGRSALSPGDTVYVDVHPDNVLVFAADAS